MLERVSAMESTCLIIFSTLLLIFAISAKKLLQISSVLFSTMFTSILRHRHVSLKIWFYIIVLERIHVKIFDVMPLSEFVSSGTIIENRF